MMKKLLLFVVMMFMLTSAVGASGGNSDIKLSADNGNITFEALCELEEEGKVTMFALKDGDSPVADRVYGVSETTAKPGEKLTFQIYIPDQRRLSGERGSGRYTIYINNKDGQPLITKSFDYADSIEVEEFIKDLKEKADMVTDKNKAYESLGELMSEENAGVFFAIGIDYEQYKNADESVQQDTLNILYANGVEGLKSDTLPDAFKCAFGLASYNNGDNSEGVEILAPEYNDRIIGEDDELFGKTLTLMEKEYDSIKDFRAGFKIAYGISCINDANKYEMEEVLDVFEEETGECSSEISKLAKLSESKKEKAYEYMVLSIKKNKIKSLSELEALLDEAYEDATKDSNSSGGGSSGGGGGGAVVSGKATGNGIIRPDEKEAVSENKTEMIFMDLSEEHWSAESVRWLRDRGVVNGTDKGTFEPDREVTREEFTKMIVAVCGFELSDGELKFEDADKDMWYAPYIVTATELGVVKGISENDFGIGQNISRQDMAVMVERAAEIKGAELLAEREYTGFADEADISDYAKMAVRSLFGAGIINGKGNDIFDPLGNATRAEAAKIIYEAFK